LFAILICYLGLASSTALHRLHSNSTHTKTTKNAVSSPISIIPLNTLTFTNYTIFYSFKINSNIPLPFNNSEFDDYKFLVDKILIDLYAPGATKPTQYSAKYDATTLSSVIILPFLAPLQEYRAEFGYSLKNNSQYLNLTSTKLLTCYDEPSAPFELTFKQIDSCKSVELRWKHQASPNQIPKVSYFIVKIKQNNVLIKEDKVKDLVDVMKNAKLGTIYQVEIQALYDATIIPATHCTGTNAVVGSKTFRMTITTSEKCDPDNHSSRVATDFYFKLVLSFILMIFIY